MKKSTYLLTLLTAFLWLGSGTMWGESTLGPLYDGTNSYGSYVPLEGNNADRFQRVQVIYPKADLTAMKGKKITKMTFYIKTNASKDWNAPIQIRLAETSDDYFATSSYKSAEWTVVYEGTDLSAKTGKSTMEVSFDNDFVYSGDNNLLFELLITAKTGSYASAAFVAKGGYDYNYSVYKYSTSGTSPLDITSGTGRPMRPKTLFTYEDAGPSCADPTSVTASVASATSATVEWTEEGEATAWQVRTSSNGGTSWSDPVAATTNPFTLSGLTEGTTYNVQVRAKCDEELFSEWVDAASTVTPVSCPSVTAVTLSNKLYNSVTVNWTLNGATNCDVRYKEADDADWTPVGTGISATTKTISGLVPGGTYTFEVKSSCGETWVAAGETYAPAFPVPAPSASDITDAQATVSWSALLDNPNYKYIRVAAGSDAPDAEAWESAVSTDQTSVALTSLVGGTSYDVYVRAVYAGGEGEPAKVTFTTTTIAPTNLTQGTTTTSSIAFSWSYAGAATQFQWKSSKSGSNWSDPISVTNAEETGLSDGESYSFDVRAYYADGIYSTILSGSFATACAAKSLPYSCGFENTDADVFTNNGYNNCWKKIGSPYASTNSTYKRAGSRGLCIGGTDEQYAILPVFEDAVKGMQISFWYKNYFPTSYASTLVLGSMTDPTDKATFTPIKTLDASSSFVQVVEQSLESAGADDYYIAFKYTGANQYSAIALDDITVEALPSCVKPTGVEASNVTGTTADISWSSSASAWKLQYSTDGTNWTDVNGGNNITDNPYTLEGLTPNHTTYYVRVKADCGGGDLSDWSNPSAAFETECADITVDADHEWQENFNNQTANQIPACWTAAGNTDAVYVTSSSGDVTLTSKALYFTGGSGTEAIAILPDFTTDVNTLQIAFSHVEENKTSSGKVRFGYYKDATFTALKTCDYSTSSSSWKDEAAFAIKGVPAGANLAFAYKPNSNAYRAAVDNIVISMAASCAVPSEVAGEGLSTTTASISWTAGGEETAWKLQYSTDGENWTDANGGNNITDKPYVLTELSAGTTYYARVKADCDGDMSDWSAASAGFKTDCNAQAMPFEEAFDATLPECWKIVTIGDKTWGASSSTYYRHSASYSWSYSAYTSADNYSDLITPAIILDEDALLKFYVSNYAYSGTNVTAEVYIQYGSTTEKIFDIPTISTGYTPEQQVIDLSNYTGKTAKFIFRAHGNGQTAYKYIYIDDVEVKAKPCDAPTALSVAASSHDAVATWTDDTADKWNLRWHEVGAATWNEENGLTEKTCTISTGLELGKTYEVQVQAVCSATKNSDWTSLEEFALICTAPSALAVTARTANSATFSWTSSENAWVLEYSTDGENWESENVTANPFTLEGLTAGQAYQAKIQSACGSAFSNVVEFSTWCDSKLSLPVELTSFNAIPACWEESPAGAVQIANNKLCFVGEGEKFLYLPQTDVNLNLLSATFTFSGSLEFGYIDAPNGAFQAFETQPTSSVELNMEGEVAAAKYIAIRYNGASAWAQAAISAISIRKTPNCAKPDAPAVTPGVGSASISWTAGGSETAWNLQYKLASVASWDGAAQVAVSENPSYNLSGLEQGLSYKVRVQAACAGEELSDWSDEASFTTDCDVIAALPFIETFDAALSNCWDITDDNTSTYPSQVYGGDLCLPGGKAASGHLVVLPEITASLANATMTIEYTATAGANTATPQVGYIDNESAFQELASLAKSGTAITARVELADADGHRLALRYDDGTSEGDFNIREIRILEHLTLTDTDNNSDIITANNGKQVDVTIGRTFFCDGDYNTICLPFSLPTLDGTPLEGAILKAYKYAVIEPDELQVRVVDAESIVAGTPYLIKFAEGENIVDPLFTNVTISATEGKTIGQGEPVAFRGVLVPQPFDKGDETTLFVHTGNTLTWAGREGTSLKSFRAFFQRTPASSGAPLRYGMRARIVEQEETATGINDVQTNTIQSIKLLENDQVVIIRNGVKYNVQGQVIEREQ